MAQRILIDVYNLPAGGKHAFEAGGVEYDRRLAKKRLAAAIRSLSELTRYYKVGIKRRGRAGVLSLNSGLRRPIRVSDTMRQFVQNGNFGDASIGGRLQDYLALLLTEGVTTRTLLNSLFHLYIARNNLVSLAGVNAGRALEQQNGSFFGPDALMRQVFATTFQQMANEQALKLRGSLDAQGQPARAGAMRPNKEGKDPRKYYRVIDGQQVPIYNDFYHDFDINNIPRSAITTIVKFNTVKMPDDEALFKLTDNEVAAYRQVIDAARAAGQVPAFEAFAQQALANLTAAGLADAGSAQRLQIRGRADGEELIVRETLKSVPKTVKKRQPSRRPAGTGRRGRGRGRPAGSPRR